MIPEERLEFVGQIFAGGQECLGRVDATFELFDVAGVVLVGRGRTVDPSLPVLHLAVDSSAARADFVREAVTDGAQ